MWPYVIEHPIPIGTYGVMMAVGFLVGYWLMVKEFRRRNVPVEMAETTVLICIITGILGSKLAYLLTEAETWSWQDLLSGSGLTWHGGFILAAVSAIIYWRRRKMPLLVMLDSLAPMLATGYAAGRVGCHLAGDGDYGIPCNVTDIDYSWCMSYPNGIIPTTDLVHPTPVYEVLSNLLLFALLWGLRKRIRHPGILFGIYCIGSGVLRFFVEFIRQSEGRPDRFLNLRDAQLVALATVIVGIVFWVVGRVRPIPVGQEYGVLTVTQAPPRPARKARKRRAS